jgi:ankyrin repeat protein
MSMHEIEDVVEASIRTLAENKGEHGLDLRAAFQTLYDFQDLHDTGFTNFRVMDLLLEAGYTHRFPIDQHPEYQRHRDYFDALDDFEFIHLNPDEPWDRETNPSASYYNEGHCYCDRASPLWDRLVENGIITGENALQLENLTLAEVVATVVTLAEAGTDRELIRMWYPLFILGSFDWEAEALHRLQENPHVQVIREITLRTNALAIEMNYGTTALPSLDQISDIPVLEWWFDLGNSGADPSQPTNPDPETEKGALLEAIKSGDIDQLKSLIEGGLSPDATIEGQPVLMLTASVPKRDAILKYLISKGANIESKGSLGITPLSWAASSAQVENVRTLLAAGANVHAKARGGNTPLMAALYLGIEGESFGETGVRDSVLEIVRLLIDAGADVNQRSSDGGSAMHAAVLMKSPEAIKLLLDAGAETDAKSKDPDVDIPPNLHSAAKSGAVAIVKQLLDSGTDVNLLNHEGRTPLMIAAKRNHLGLVKLFLERGADPMIEDKGHLTTLFHAIKGKRLEIVEYLLEKFPQINQAQGMFQYTPLMWACMQGSDLELVKRLIQRGAHPGDQDPYGRTAITFALINEHKKLIDWFQEHYPDMEYRLPGRLGIELPSSKEEEQVILQSLGIEFGVPVRNVFLTSPADAADFQLNDVITRVEDTDIHNSIGLVKTLGGFFDGDVVHCVILRGGETISLELTLRYKIDGQLKF